MERETAAPFRFRHGEVPPRPAPQTGTSATVRTMAMSSSPRPPTAADCPPPPPAPFWPARRRSPARRSSPANPSVPIVEIPYRDPLAAFTPFANDATCAFLDSAAAGDPRARWSYIAAEPFSVIVAGPDGVAVDGRPVEGDPFAVLQRMLATRVPAASQGGPEIPFRGGAVGFLGYELGRHLERLPVPYRRDPPMPDMVVGLYDAVLAFDTQAQRAFLVRAEMPADTDSARQRGETLLRRLATAPPAPPAPDWRIREAFTPDRPRATVEAAVARAIAYIEAGDIFQANITQTLRAQRPAGLDDLALYLRLRALSPAPFAALLRCGPDLALMSASPERFLSLSPDGRVETRPIKGTRPRGASPQADAALAAALAAAPKDRAENLMIVDLLRNDISRVAALGSVQVPVLCALESFASVHHLVSVVEGRLTPGLGPVDLLRACFPGGSVTGAPKIRAMEIIHELEGAPRGPYCGAIAWIGFDGAMDSAITIRTIVRGGETLLAQAGGGIVADSDPAAEYEESLVKLAPLRHALSGERP